MNAVGAWIRYVAFHIYGVALFGQTISAIAQIGISAASVTLAQNWFPYKERTWVVVTVNFAYNIGWAFGAIFPAFFIDSNDPMSIAGGLERVLLVESIFATPAIFLFFFFMNKRMRRIRHEKGTYIQHIKEMLRNRKLVIAIIVYGLAFAVTYIVSSLIQPLLPEDYDMMTVGIIGLCFLGSGSIGSVLATIYLELRSLDGNYDNIIKIFVLFSFVSLILLAIFLSSASLGVIIFLNVIAGIGLITYTPFIFQSLVETSFPVDEALIVTTFLYVASIFGIIGNSIATAPAIEKHAMWVLVILVFPSAVYALFFQKTEFKVLEFEKSASIKQSSTIATSEHTDGESQPHDPYQFRKLQSKSTFESIADSANENNAHVVNLEPQSLVASMRSVSAASGGQTQDDNPLEQIPEEEATVRKLDIYETKTRKPPPMPVPPPAPPV
jgi:hypothetical protein